MNEPVLADTIVLIMGGTGGMGLAAAQACLRAGARVVAVGPGDQVERAGTILGDAGRVLSGDAREPHSGDRAVQEAVHTFGRLDGLLHVAGGSGRAFGDGPLHEATTEGWDATLQLNLTSVFYSNRAAVRQFLAQESGGSILNVGSVLADSPAPALFDTIAYPVAKAGIVGLSRTIAARYAPHNIRCNVVAPGLMETPMARRAAEDPRIREYVGTKQPLDGGRIGTPEDLVGAMVFLLSNQARFVTGQVWSIDGGWAVSEGQIPAGDAPDA